MDVYVARKHTQMSMLAITTNNTKVCAILTIVIIFECKP